MKNKIGRTVLLIRNYEASAAFYEQIFEFERIVDFTTHEGQRFLQIGDKENNVGLWLLKAQGEEQEDRIGNQTSGQPTIVIYTEDLKKIHKRLKVTKTKIKVEPAYGSEFAFLHCYDYDGNEIVVVELKA